MDSQWGEGRVAVPTGRNARGVLQTTTPPLVPPRARCCTYNPPAKCRSPRLATFAALRHRPCTSSYNPDSSRSHEESSRKVHGARPVPATLATPEDPKARLSVPELRVSRGMITPVPHPTYSLPAFVVPLLHFARAGSPAMLPAVRASQCPYHNPRGSMHIQRSSLALVASLPPGAVLLMAPHPWRTHRYSAPAQCQKRH